VSGAWVIVGYTLREAVRRRVVAVVAALTAAFLGLYALGVWRVFQDVEGFGPEEALERGIDTTTLAGGTMLGMAMFGTLFLGVVLAVFLTLGAVRGDAERGLLQPLIVRPIGRRTFVLARFAGAAVISAAYTVAVYAGAMVTTGLIGGWWPDRIVTPALLLAGAIVLMTAISVLGSVAFTATANGIAVFMVFGAGLVAGLLGQVAEALSSDTLDRISSIATWVLPFEALYQASLSALTADTSGLTESIIQLGPFGGASDGGIGLWLWSAAYLAGVCAAAVAWFSRCDLG